MSAARAAAIGVPLPVRASAVDLGVIEDAEGRDFATIDINGERPDEAVRAIARAVADAINAACWPDAAPALIDLKHAPSAMEQRYAGRGPR